MALKCPVTVGAGARVLKAFNSAGIACIVVYLVILLLITIIIIIVKRATITPKYHININKKGFYRTEWSPFA